MCHFNIRSRQGKASWGFPVVGKATGRKEASRKAHPVGGGFENLRRSVSHTRLPACLLDGQGSLEVTLLNQLVVTTNVTTGTGRKEGRKEERKEGRTKKGCANRDSNP